MLALIGIGDMLGNLLFAAASTSGLVSITSVLASLYPIVTVVLARIVLRERVRDRRRPESCSRSPASRSSRQGYSGKPATRRSISSRISRTVSSVLTCRVLQLPVDVPLAREHRTASPQPIVTTTSAHSASAVSSFFGTRSVELGHQLGDLGCTRSAGVVPAERALPPRRS